MAGTGEAEKAKTDDDDDFNPYEHRELVRPTSDIETLLHILKGCFGTGFPAMPEAFMFVGLFNGMVSTLVIGALCSYGFHILVKAEYQICKKKKLGVVDYKAALKYSFEMGPEKLRKFSRTMGIVVDVFLMVAQIGIGCIYIIFVAVNVKRFTDEYIKPNFSTILWLTFKLPTYIAFVLIPDLKYLVPFSIFGNIATLIAVVIVCYYIFQGLPPISKVSFFKLDMNYPLYFGTTLFSFESIGVIVTAEQNMKHPNHFLGIFGVLNIGLFIVVIVHMIVGFFGYWRYGSETRDAITLNIPHSEVVAKLVILVYALAIYFSFSLQCFVANTILWNNYLINHFKNSTPRRLMIYENLFRVMIVLIIYIMSITVPLLGIMISFVGAFCMATLGFIIPCIMDLCVRWPDDLGKHNWVIYHHAAIMIFGVLGVSTGTYCAFREMFKSIAKGKIYLE